MGKYNIAIFYPDGTKWEGPYTSSAEAWNALCDIILENHSLRGYVYNITTKRRIATYGMPLDE